MSNYNGAKFLAQAIESILNQTYSDFEFIIIDDGSTDNSRVIAEEYAAKDKRIILSHNKKNLTLPTSLNLGLLSVHGEYIVRMDSDDVAMPRRIEKLLSFMEEPGNENIAVCGSMCEVIDENSKVIGMKKFPQEDIEIKEALWFRNPIQHSAAIIRKRCLDELGGYNVSFPQTQDYELWFRIGRTYKLHNFPEALLQYRVHGGNAIFKKQKNMIRLALRARRMGVRDYGYKMTFSGRIFNIATYIALLLPSSFVVWLFARFQGNE
jgi:glycosyltransferase involved in cell wall biosynthesis